MLLKQTDPLLVFIGPSATGKSTLVRQLVEQELIEATPSYTTRPMRDGEHSDINEHIFCNEKQFQKYEIEKRFLEVVQLYGLPFKYGMPRPQKPTSNKVPVMMLSAAVLDKLARHFPNAIIYHIEAPRDIVEKRLHVRAKTGYVIGTRLQSYTAEINAGREQAHRVFCEIDQAVLLAKVIHAIGEDLSIHQPPEFLVTPSLADATHYVSPASLHRNNRLTI